MKISVVIPAFNEAGTLEHCLNSLRLQTRQPDTIIVVDNNSTDATAHIARKFGATVVKESRQGIWAAAYAGYSHATSDIIARCDADSILPPNWIARIEQAFKDDSIAAVTGPGKFYGAPPVTCLLANTLYMKSYFKLVGLALKHPPLFGSNFAMRTATWQQVKATTHHKNENIHDDIDLSYHLPKGSVIIYDPTFTVGISARPLHSFRGMVQRYKKGFRSIFIHWPAQAPWNK